MYDNQTMYDNIHANSFGIAIYHYNGEVQLVPWAGVEQIRLVGDRICVQFRDTYVWLNVPAPLELVQAIFDDSGRAATTERIATALEKLTDTYQEVHK